MSREAIHMWVGAVFGVFIGACTMLVFMPRQIEPAQQVVFRTRTISLNDNAASCYAQGGDYSYFLDQYRHEPSEKCVIEKEIRYQTP